MMQQIDSIEFDLLRNTDGIQINSNVANVTKFQNKGPEIVLERAIPLLRRVNGSQRNFEAMDVAENKQRQAVLAMEAFVSY